MPSVLMVASAAAHWPLADGTQHPTGLHATLDALAAVVAPAHKA